MVSLLEVLKPTPGLEIEGKGCPRTLVSILDLNPRKFGSMEEYLVLLSDALRKSGWRHFLFFNDLPEEQLLNRFQDMGAMVGVCRVDSTCESYRDMIGIIRRCRPLIVHFHFLSPFSLYPLLARIAGAENVVFTEHMCPPIFRSVLRTVKFWTWDRVVLQLLGVEVFPVSRFVENVLLSCYRISSKRTTVLYNGVNIERFDPDRSDVGKLRQSLGIPEQVSVVLTAAYLVREKGVGDLLAAAAEILELKRDTWFVIVGDGPEFKNLGRQAAELGIEGNTRFVGLRSDIPRFMAMASVVVVPSVCQEAAGLVVIEAMAMGRPVVATRVGGVPEYLEDGSTGLLVDPGRPDQIAAAIVRLLDSPESRKAMGDRGRQRIVERFSMRNWVKCTIDAYMRVVGN